MKAGILAFLSTCAVVAVNAVAQDNETLFSRCYRQITGQRFPIRFQPVDPNDDDTFLSQLKADLDVGNTSYVQACMRVLARAQLNPTGQLQAASSSLAISVLNNFHHFHNAFIGEMNFSANSVVSAPSNRQADAIDETAPTYYYTQALFRSDLTYDSVLTYPYLLYGVRDEPIRYMDVNGAPVERLPIFSMFHRLQLVNYVPGCTPVNGQPTSCYTPLLPTLPMTGNLIGIAEVAPSSSNPRAAEAYDNNVLAFIVNSGSNPDRGIPTRQFPLNDSDRFYFNRPAGGGYLGTQAFMLANWNLDEFPLKIPDRGLVSPRLWARAVLKSALCRDLPVLPVDAPVVVDAVQNPCANDDLLNPDYNPAGCSKLPFRSSVVCMSCHITIDGDGANIEGLTPLLRNYRLRRAVSSSSQGNTAWLIPYPLDPNAVPERRHRDRDPQFHRQTPTGGLNFTSYDGGTYEQSLQDIEALGAALIGTRDFYACGVARYLRFFTGIDMKLGSGGDPSEAPYRALFDSLVDRFQARRNVRLLIEDILSSELYQTETMRF